MPTYRADHPEYFREYDQKRHKAAKLAAFEKLGGAFCRGCGETELEFLTLGHLNGDGAKDRSDNGRRTIYLEIARGIRSPEDYSVQCRNCNCGENLEAVHSRLPTSKHEKTGVPCPECGVPKLVRSSAHPKYGTRKRTECRGCSQIRKREMRVSAIAFLGGVCTCCKKKDLPFLNIDHVNNDGSTMRSLDRCGRPKFYSDLLSSKIDSRLYQVLCRNCNHSKHIGNGVCVHARKEV
jgi:ssDNA-binding Zn-finger/Zn-ribbon topoisomerase 1